MSEDDQVEGRGYDEFGVVVAREDDEEKDNDCCHCCR